MDGNLNAARSGDPGAARTIALLFPGQGSQSADMRENVEAQRPDLLALARSEVSEDLFERAAQGKMAPRVEGTITSPSSSARQRAPAGPSPRFSARRWRATRFSRTASMPR